MIDALLHQEHTPYREIGERSVAHMMDRAGIPLHEDEVRVSGGADRAAAAVSGGAGGAWPAADAVQDRRAVERRSRHAGGRRSSITTFAFER